MLTANFPLYVTGKVKYNKLFRANDICFTSCVQFFEFRN
jgi:hypothetical protein